MAVNDDALLGDAVMLHQPIARCAAILQNAACRGCPFTFSVAGIVKNQDVAAKIISQFLGLGGQLGNIHTVSVAVQKSAACDFFALIEAALTRTKRKIAARQRFISRVFEGNFLKAVLNVPISFR